MTVISYIQCLESINIQHTAWQKKRTVEQNRNNTQNENVHNEECISEHTLYYGYTGTTFFSYSSSPLEAGIQAFFLRAAKFVCFGNFLELPTALPYIITLSGRIFFFLHSLLSHTHTTSVKISNTLSLCSRCWLIFHSLSHHTHEEEDDNKKGFPSCLRTNNEMEEDTKKANI
jgi:hypothetical protein